ncbi:MAG: hypothetical protein DSO02_06790 [Hadesarchaea archaeon]|nr:MAG: hypothetical protein DSO02_06790 [Hadesarchaea archaeon]
MMGSLRLRDLRRLTGGQYLSSLFPLLVASGAAGTREEFEKAGLGRWWLKQVDRFLKRVEGKVKRGRKPTPLEIRILLGLGREFDGHPNSPRGG